MKKIASLNGFGRFGLHFLNYYIERAQSSSFYLKYINDEQLSVNQMVEIIKSDRYVRILENCNIFVEHNSIFLRQDSKSIEIELSNMPISDFLKGKQGIFFECSGQYTNVSDFPEEGLLQRIYISATSVTAHKTLIVGFNEANYRENDKFISYGSCTVNAYVPLAYTIHNKFGIIDSDVNVIHNVPEYKLHEIPNCFERRDCTLNFMGPKLLNFLTSKNFNVNYTLVPISGVSRIDMRFRLKKDFSLQSVLTFIDQISAPRGNKLYKVHDVDPGQYSALLSRFSAEIILEQSRKSGDNLYLSAYFDTENSVNRYYDLIESIEEHEVNNVKKY